METISINDLYNLKESLGKKGYTFKENTNGKLVFFNNENTLEFLLNDYIDIQHKLLMPNYENCILNVVASVEKHYGFTPKYKTNSKIDEILNSKKYKHIAIMILDGMGSYIMRKNLSDESFLQTNKICDIRAVFPSTTACAIPATCSGLEPLKTGWVGWENYFKEIKEYVVMFRNIEYFSSKPLNINIERDILPYKKFYEKFNTNTFDLGPSFTPSNCKTIEELCNKYIQKTNELDSSFAYLYWDNPDMAMHEFGSYSQEAKNVLNNIDKALKDMSEKLSDDTLIIATADHGHIDCNPIYISKFKDIMSTLTRLPGNEGRAAFFKVTPFKKRKFEKLFNNYFGNYFALIKRKDFIEEGYLGPNYQEVNSHVIDFIGDYVAIAKSTYYFDFTPDGNPNFIMKSHHAGITANEMVIPLIKIVK